MKYVLIHSYYDDRAEEEESDFTIKISNNQEELVDYVLDDLEMDRYICEHVENANEIMKKAISDMLINGEILWVSGSYYNHNTYKIINKNNSTFNFSKMSKSQCTSYGALEKKCNLHWKQHQNQTE